jgi:hypothetical protein
MLVVVLQTSAVRAYFGLWCTVVSVFRAATAVGPRVRDCPRMELLLRWHGPAGS